MNKRKLAKQSETAAIRFCDYINNLIEEMSGDYETAEGMTLAMLISGLAKRHGEETVMKKVELILSAANQNIGRIDPKKR